MCFHVMTLFQYYVSHKVNLIESEFHVAAVLGSVFLVVAFVFAQLFM